MEDYDKELFMTAPQEPVVKKFDSSINSILEFKAIPHFEKYYSEDTIWGCYMFFTDIEIPYSKELNDYDAFEDKYVTKYQSTLVGKMQKLYIGSEYDIKAKLVYNTKFKSYQWEAITVSQEIPKTIKQQAQFLKSIVTKNQAKVLLNVYPNIVEEVVNGKEEIDLNLTKGIKDFTWNLIKQKILDNYVIADILTLLVPLGISYNKIKNLLNNEPNPLVLKQKLLEDPYILAEASGVSFKQADQVATKINPEFMISRKRVNSFIKSYLREIGENEGHTWIAVDKLELAIKENIIECLEIYETVIEEEKVFPIFLHIEENRIGLQYYWFVEKEIWRLVNEFNEANPLWVSQEEIDEGIRVAEEKQGKDFHFTEEQKDFLVQMTGNNFNIITGYSGTGKTTLTKGLLEIYNRYSVGACALSAKAAKRIEEVTGFQASTIHRLLGAKGPNQFSFNKDNPLPYDIILVDEISMVFSGLFYNLITSIKPTAKIILVGDSGQLNPIGFGNLLVDLLGKTNLQICRLTKIQRQAAASGIISSANLIREGVDPLNGEKTFKKVYGELQDQYFMFRTDRDDLFNIAIKTYLKSVEEVGLDNVYLITPRKENCEISTKNFNKAIQDILLDNSLPFVKYGKDGIFKLGAKVIHRINDYELGVMNGEQGYVTNILNMQNNEGGSGLIVNYGDKEIEYNKLNLNELSLAYSVSIHLSQGSEAHTVIVVLDNSSFTLLNNCLLYTALTRAKSRCLLLSQPYSYDKCINTNVGNKRNTWTRLF